MSRDSRAAIDRQTGTRADDRCPRSSRCGIGPEGFGRPRSATRDRSDADFERYLRWRVGPGRSRPGVRVERRPRSRDWVGTETRDDAWLHQLRPPEITPALESAAGRSAI